MVESEILVWSGGEFIEGDDGVLSASLSSGVGGVQGVLFAVNSGSFSFQSIP